MVHIRDFRRLCLEYLEPRATPAITWDVSFDDPGNTFGAYHDEIKNTIVAAGNDWARFLHGADASIEITVHFGDLGGRILAESGSAFTIVVKKNGNLSVDEGSVGHEIRTGKDSNGSQPDANITVDTSKLTTDMWFDPTPGDREDEVIPSNKEDAYSVFLHELGHCLGFQGNRDHATGELTGTSETLFDEFVTVADDGTPSFDGPSAVALNDNLPVPLTKGSPYHLQGSDLMNGTGLPLATRLKISSVDIAILHDIGLPIANDPPVIGQIPDQFVHTDSSTEVTIPISDGETAARDLRITADASNPDLISPGSLVFDGTGSERTLHLSPQLGQEGLAQITLHLDDGYVQTDRSFNVRVSTNPFPWQNPTQPLDVNDDSSIDPLDALVVINRVNKVGPGPLAWREPQTATPPYYDVHADNNLAPDDALAVINYINNQIAHKQTTAAEGEAAEAQEQLLSLTLESPTNHKAARI